MRDDVRAAGIDVAKHDADESLRLAELRVVSGLKLPACCVLDVPIRNHASIATFDEALAATWGDASPYSRRRILISSRWDA